MKRTKPPKSRKANAFIVHGRIEDVLYGSDVWWEKAEGVEVMVVPLLVYRAEQAVIEAASKCPLALGSPTVGEAIAHLEAVKEGKA